MPAIAQASPRLAAMNIGGEDFALETGMEPTEETLLMPKQQMVFAARAPASCRSASSPASPASATGTPSAAWCAARASSASWPRAASTIPGQVPIDQPRVTSPARKMKWAYRARRIVEANARHEAGGQRLLPVARTGKMIDVPVVVRAQPC
jgi:citrate lyase subunit beta/citryl-CoA lyase